MLKSTHELNLDHFAYNAGKLSALHIFLHCGQQRGKMFDIVGNNAEELPQCKTVQHFFRASFYL
jgi:hypothetical protein